MALRFVAVLSVFSIFLVTIYPSVGISGGPPVLPPPVCAPPACPPPSCAPPSCGPNNAGPFGLLGGCLGFATNLCGAVIGIPSAIMGGLLAPAPKRIMSRPNCAPPACAPPVCGPIVCPPTTCAPPMCMPTTCAPPVCAPSRITKCKPYAAEGYYPVPVVRYQSGPVYAPAAYSPAAIQYQMPAPTSSFQQAISMAPYFLDIPFKLVSGTLQGSGLHSMSLASTATVNDGSRESLW